MENPNSALMVDPNQYKFVYSNNNSAYGYGSDTGNSFWNGFIDLFSGGKTSMDRQNYYWKQDADKVLQDRLYEQANLKSARDFELFMDSSKYQRAVEDLKKAGLNPWLAVQGGLNASGGNYQPSANVSTRNDQSVNKNNNDKANGSSILSSALKILMAVALLG